MQDLKSWMSCSSFIWSRFLTSKDWEIYCNLNLSFFFTGFVFQRVHMVWSKKGKKKVFWQLHISVAFILNFLTSLPRHSLTPLPLLAVRRSEFNLGFPLKKKKVLQELGEAPYSEVRLALWPPVVIGFSAWLHHSHNMISTGRARDYTW